MNQYLVGQGYWSYINGAQENKPETTHANYPTWEQGASRVMYCLATCVNDHMLSHIRDAKTPKEAWENLKKIFAADTSARKLQLRQELNNIRQKEMSVTDYTAKIKSICDSLGSINVNIDEDEMVQVCLGGLAQRFNPLRTAILARDTPPSFFNLQSMLLVEENHVQPKTNTSEGQMLFSDTDGAHRRGRRGRGQFDLSHEGNSQFRQGNGSHRGTFTRRGSFHAEQGRRTTPPTCNYCGKIGHREEECRKRRSESASTSRQLTNYAANAEYADYGGLFVMRHRANSMMASDPANSASTSNSEHAWFVDSGASHHMTSHQEWFRDLRTPDRPGYIETGDDTPHPIRHIGDVPFGKEGEQTCIKNVLHVPTITKNLVSVGQIVEQGMQVRFNNEGCFIEKDGRLIAKGRRDGRLFILDSNEVKSAMYAKGLKTETNIELWHKRIGHVNLQRLRGMQSKGVVIGLPAFESKRVDRVCEACQLGKQHRLPFPKESSASKGLLDVIHSDVWGPAQTPTLGGCRYYVTFIDDHSRYAWIYPMKKKSEVLSHFQRLKSQVEKETGRHIRCLRSDGGKEYFSDEFTSYLQGEGIRREFSCRHTPQQNGVAERKNRQILEVARAMMREKHMPNFYWAEAASTAVYLMNRCTTNSVHELTPYEIFVGRKPILSHLKVFGSIANVRIPNESREKPDAKSEECILIGYLSAKKAYKCFNPSTRAVRISRDVVFDESASWYKPDATPSDPIEEELNANSDDETRPSPPPKDNPSSTELIGPQEPPRDENTSRPSPTSDKGKGKMPEYEVEVHPDDRDSDDSARSLDSEFGVPIMRTPGVKKALTSTNEKLRRSSRAKTQVTRYAYNEYMAHHYALAMKVVAEQEPEDPSLRHRLEGENKAAENRATKPRRREESRATPRRKPQAAPMPTKPKEAKPDVGRLTLELEGAC